MLILYHPIYQVIEKLYAAINQDILASVAKMNRMTIYLQNQIMMVFNYLIILININMTLNISCIKYVVKKNLLKI
jgi:hypothetical protein